MATYKLIPSSLWRFGYVSISNSQNTLADADSGTYAVVNLQQDTAFLLKGFDFSSIPSSEEIQSITVKVLCANINPSYPTHVMLAGDLTASVQLSDITMATSGQATLYTLNLTAGVETIEQYKDTLCLGFFSSGGYPTVNVYGAEIDVSTVASPSPPPTPTPSKNKVVYGNNTLIDLSGDTVTAADVALGKTFHLPSGAQAVGALAGLHVANVFDYNSNTNQITFHNLECEPSWFVMVVDYSDTNFPCIASVYDGNTLYSSEADGDRGGYVFVSTVSGSSAGWFSYTNESLTIYSYRTMNYSGYTLYYG